METTVVYWGYIGRMENKMETTIVYRDYIGIMENCFGVPTLLALRNALGPRPLSVNPQDGTLDPLKDLLCSRLRMSYT